MTTDDPNVPSAPFRSDAERLAWQTRGEALTGGHAVVVGNRAGVVEWTGGSWQRLTGFPLEETIDKPISHFLDRAGLELELVDFVAQHFLDGRPCTVALSFETLDGRHLDLQLDVEPIRDAGGEIRRFVAVVQEQPRSRPDAAAGVSTPRIESQRSPKDRTLSRESRQRQILAIAPIAAAALARTGRCQRRSASFDCAFDEARVPIVSPAPGAPGHATASARLANLLDHLLAASLAADAVGPRHVTLLSGRLRPGRSHHSLAHAIPQRRVASLANAHPFLEVHDTSVHLDREALERVRAGRPASDPREMALVAAGALAERVGAVLLLDSTPGCGNQALVVFEATGRL